MKTNLLTLENAKQFIEDYNLQDEFKKWAELTEESTQEEIDYYTIDFAEASDEFNDWLEENFESESETEYDAEGDYWEAKINEKIEERLFGRD